MILRSWMVRAGHEEVNVHLIACPRTREAALVDAGGFPTGLRDTAARLGLRVARVLITHLHFDHVDALEEIRRAYACEVVAPEPMGTGSRVVREGDEVRVGTLRGRVVQTSGHTPESVSYVFREGVVFTGDALFAGSVGGTQTPAQQREELRHVREKILTLPGEWEIRPGHGPATTVEIERTANPFFQ